MNRSMRDVPLLAQCRKETIVSLAVSRVVLVSLAILALTSPALSVPPYTEEWSVPAVPQDVEVDPSGRVWVSCADDTIRVYTPSGGSLVLAFGGTGTDDGQFQTPYGMAFDPSGAAYICDYAGSRVEKFTSEGVFLLAWPIPSNRADHVAVDAAGDVYVTGYTDLAVHKFDSAGVPLDDWPSVGGSTTAGIVEVMGTINVVQWDAPAVEQFTTDGTYLGSFATETFGCTDIEVDAANQLLVADYSNHRIRTFTADGIPIDAFGSFGSGPGEFNGAIGVAVGLDGSIYVADEGNARIQRFGGTLTGISPDDDRSGQLAIRSIAPNPGRTAFELTYDLARDGQVELTIMDVRGRVVATLAQETATAGTHRLQWTAKSLPAGVYFARLVHGGNAEVARLTVVK